MMNSVVDLTQAKEIAAHVCRMLTSQMQMPEFSDSGGVPTDVAAKVLGKDASYVLQGIEDGWLPIGTMKPPKPGERRRNPYISPKLFWEFTGYVWKGGGKNAGEAD